MRNFSALKFMTIIDIQDFLFQGPRLNRKDIIFSDIFINFMAFSVKLKVMSVIWRLPSDGLVAMRSFLGD